MVNQIEMLLGEIRRITAEITVDRESSGFTISNPKYSLKKGNTEVDSGTVVSVENQITCTIAPKEVGSYNLDFSFDIADEHLIKRVILNVKR
jgi:hypothetical protein